MRQQLSLNDSAWFVGGVAPQPFGAVIDLESVQGWLPASVPGDVRLDLLRAGKIPDPFLGYNNEASQWVDEWDWWYRRDLELNTDPDARVFIAFEGIDYQSAIFWDGVELGRHVGMFSRQVYEIPRELSAGSQHQLAVRVWGPDQLPRLKLDFTEGILKKVAGWAIPRSQPVPEFPDRYATLKTAMSFGWDFAPRLRTCGIWDDAWLIQTGAVFIRDVWVQGVPDGRMRVTLDLDTRGSREVYARLKVHGKNFDNGTQTFDASWRLNRPGHCTLGLTLDNPQVWNPWDRGLPNIYQLDVVLSDANGVLDSATTTFGLRTIELVPNEGAPQDEPPWTFSLNVNREFIRGANWVPADAIPARVMRDDYAAWLNLAREVNLNLLRVWGGGLKEKRAFYELCDELGMLVWQEFPFSGAGIDYFPRDSQYLKLVKQECGAIVRALRNHPSVVLWCGGNEFIPRLNRPLVHLLRETVALEDGTRPFKPASPSRGESHNWRVWHGKANTRDYRDDAALFFGEFGMQAAPNVETLNRFLADELLFPPGEMWKYHNAELEKLWRYAWSITPKPESLISSLPSPVSNLQSPRLPAELIAASSSGTNLQSLYEFVTASQTSQARGLQIAIEHARRNKPRVSGCAFWQFNEPWYSICWSVIDFARQPKRAYEKIKELYNPVLVCFEYPLVPRRAGDKVDGDLWLINDTLLEMSGQLRAWHNGKLVLDVIASAQPDSSRRLHSLSVTLDEGANELRVEFVGSDWVSTNEYDLNYCDVGETTPLASLLATMSAWLRESA